MVIKFNRPLFLSASAAAVAVAMAATPASAQDQAEKADSGNQLGEIVVTARKQNETIISAPLAITALSADALDSRGIADYSDLSDFVPGFRYQNQSVGRNDRGYTFFTVRGMFAGTPSPDRQGASAFIDGVPIGGGAVSGLTDVEQVEVIKGPQSAYFGRATFAGAINFITAAPSFDTKVKASASYSSYDTVELKTSVEGGIIQDLLSARVSARLYHTAGQYENAGYNEKLGAQDTRSIAGTLELTPASNLRIRAYATHWTDDDKSGASGQLQPADLNCTTKTNRAYYCGALKVAPLNRMTQQTQVGRDVINKVNGVTSGQLVLEPGFITDFGMRRKATQAHALADWEVGGGYTISANVAHLDDKWAYITDTGFRDGRGQANPFYDAANNPNGLVPYYQRTVGGQTHLLNDSAELRIASPSNDRFNWLVGANYFKQSNSIATAAFANAGFSQAVPATTYGAETYALFGSAAYDIVEGLNFSLEGRYQWDTISQLVASRNIYYEGTNKSFSPRAILRYEFDPNKSVYVSWAKGTRPGQFNATLLGLPQAVQDQVQAQLNVPSTVGPEKISMGEVGFKGNLFDRRLRLLAAAYYGKWTDKHINQNVAYSLDPSNPNATWQTTRIVVPGGEVELYGVELEATFKATRNLTLEGTLSYAETEIVKTQCGECTTLIGNDNPVGNRLPQYQAWSGSASATYSVPAFSNYNAFVRADYFYQGRQYESEANLAWIAPAHRANLRFGVENGQWNFEVFGENLFDDKTPSAIAYNADTFNASPSLTFSPARRRTFGARVSVEF